MAVRIEQLVDDLRTHLERTLPGALSAVTNADPHITLASPQHEQYYIGEPSRYKAYEAPSIFIVTNRTGRPYVMTPKEPNVEQWQHHAVLIDLLLEEEDEERLTRACYRYAEALDSCLHNQDITGVAARSWSTLLKVRGIDWGVMFTREHRSQRAFRKDVVLDLVIQHWDLLSPMA